MARQDNLIKQIAALVAAFDDASWEALASKGLLRRARKDIEKGIEFEEIDGASDVLTIRVSPFVITMGPGGPADASCTCPSSGICQHVISVGLHLQRLALDSEAPAAVLTDETIRAEISLITIELLKKWAGHAEYRSGVTLLEKNSMEPIIEYRDTVLIRLMPSALEVRYVPRGGLDGMIVSGPHPKRAVVAALLALKKSLGIEVAVKTAQERLLDMSGTPRTRGEILNSACSVLEDAIDVGLTHVSAVLSDRLKTLSVSAQAASLPRVALALKAVAEECESILNRESRANESRMLLSIARLYALMDAIRSNDSGARPDLIGTVRRQYVEVPEIELTGVGAYTWATSSGFRGLTVLFWSNSSKEFLSWSETRPSEQQFDERQRFFGEGPWEGTQSPKQVAGSIFKLRNARRTADGRLSGSSKTKALVLANTIPKALDFDSRLFVNWNELARHVTGTQAIGLRESNPLDMVVVLEPRNYGTRRFDPITQTFYWELYDNFDRPLVVALPFTNSTKTTIDLLEKLEPPEKAEWRFVARMSLTAGQWLAEPVSILRDDSPELPVFQLGFDMIPDQKVEAAKQQSEMRKAPMDESVEVLEGDEFLSEEEVANYSTSTQLFDRIRKHLEAVAESGMLNRRPEQLTWADELHSELHCLGLTVLARSLLSLSNSPSAAGVLKVCYLTHLHNQAANHLT